MRHVIRFLLFVIASDRLEMLMPTAEALSLYKISLLFTELGHWPAYRPTIRIRPILVHKTLNVHFDLHADINHYSWFDVNN